MDYLCSECSTQLSDFEMRLNRQFPIGKLYCEFCQNKKEREIIKQLINSELTVLDFYDYPKAIERMKREEKRREEKKSRENRINL